MGGSRYISGLMRESKERKEGFALRCAALLQFGRTQKGRGGIIVLNKAELRGMLMKLHVLVPATTSQLQPPSS